MAFIIFEGLDGAGKSTLIEGLHAFLKAELGAAPVLTREPGGTPIGEVLRKLLIQHREDPPCPKMELLLYEAIRAQHVECKIKPALKAELWVLCDRFTASTLAFQVGGRKLPKAPIEWLNRYATSDLVGDLTVLLDISLEESQRRMQGRHGELDRFESEKSEFHDAVRKSYLEQAKSNPESWLKLDALLPPETLLKQLINELKKRFKELQ